MMDRELIDKFLLHTSEEWPNCRQALQQRGSRQSFLLWFFTRHRKQWPERRVMGEIRVKVRGGFIAGDVTRTSR
jgi:hypothetical protein